MLSVETIKKFLDTLTIEECFALNNEIAKMNGVFDKYGFYRFDISDKKENRELLYFICKNCDSLETAKNAVSRVLDKSKETEKLYGKKIVLFWGEFVWGDLLSYNADEMKCRIIDGIDFCNYKTSDFYECGLYTKEEIVSRSLSSETTEIYAKIFNNGNGVDIESLNYVCRTTGKSIVFHKKEELDDVISGKNVFSSVSLFDKNNPYFVCNLCGEHIESKSELAVMQMVCKIISGLSKSEIETICDSLL